MKILDILLLIWAIPGLLTVLSMIWCDRKNGELTIENRPGEIFVYFLAGVFYPILLAVITPDIVKAIGVWLGKERSFKSK